MSTVETRELARRLPAGVLLAALSPAGADVGELDAAERAQVPEGDPVRRQEFIAGRIAARACLTALGVPSAPLLTRPDGSPDWPTSVRGSISHKPELCVVAAATDCVVRGLGIDIEPSKPLPGVVWAKVLSHRELSRHLGPRHVQGPRVSRLVFCAKEAYYKWQVASGTGGARDFHEVEVDVEGSSLHFSPTEGEPEGAFVVGPVWTIAAVWSLAPRPAAMSQLHRPLDQRRRCGRVAGDAPTVDGMADPAELRDPRCPTCAQPLRHGEHLRPENAALVIASGNAGVTFETQGRCENEACADFGREFAPKEWLEPIAGD